MSRLFRMKTRGPFPVFASFFQLLSTSLLVVLLIAPAAGSEELEMINRPVNTSGLTGLLATTGPFTMPYKTVEIGMAALSEKSTTPDYSLNQLPSVTVTAGLSEKSELMLGWSYVQRITTDSGRERGTGNPLIAWKYMLLPQVETSSLPSLALILGASGGGSSKEINLNGIDHWGARVGIAAGREITWGDHIVGIYADGQLVVHDLNNENQRDRYGLMNVGILFPISKYRNLQMMVEYTVSTGIDRITPQGGDYSAILYGLRLVTERFNLSIGSSFIRKQVEGFDNSNGVIGMMSFKL